MTARRTTDGETANSPVNLLSLRLGNDCGRRNLHLIEPQLQEGMLREREMDLLLAYIYVCLFFFLCCLLHEGEYERVRGETGEEFLLLDVKKLTSVVEEDE